jgi:hypothetical protein
LDFNVGIDRESIYNKCNGLCAYCGTPITIEQMEIDHYWPKHLSHLEPGIDINGESNLMPSCRRCNRHKGGYRPEEWRRLLERQVSILLGNAQFDRALRFGQVEINESPILFYFEKLNLS